MLATRRRPLAPGLRDRWSLALRLRGLLWCPCSSPLPPLSTPPLRHPGGRRLGPSAAAFARVLRGSLWQSTVALQESTACHRGCVFLLPNCWPVSWRAPAGWPRDPLGLGYLCFLIIPWPLSSHSVLQGLSIQRSPVAPSRPHTLRASTAIPHCVRLPVRRGLPEESVLAGGRGDKE